jgi:O-methyltransferase
MRETIYHRFMLSFIGRNEQRDTRIKPAQIALKTGIGGGRRLFSVLKQCESALRHYRIYCRFRSFTMIPAGTFITNLAICEKFEHISGAVVECGTWKGGMIAGIATLFNDDRDYFLYDSFEGLPNPSRELDGEEAMVRMTKPHPNGILVVSEAPARKAMELSGAKNVHIVKGWFNDTLPKYPKTPIGILRLDGDWYQSTMDILVNLYPYVVPGGIIILDDYYAWEGCTRAVHDYLTENQLVHPIRQFWNNVAYIRKE